MPAKKRYTDEEFEYLKTLCKEGYYTMQIANALNEKFHNGEAVRTKESVRKKVFRTEGLNSVYFRKEKDGLFYCSHCRTYKEREEFSIDSHKKSGIRSICKACNSKYRVYGLPSL